MPPRTFFGKEGADTVRFVVGGTGSGKTEFVLRDIEKKLKETEKRILLIVPEQQTVVYETLLAERFEPSAALRLEAASFTRLVNSVARTVGGLSPAALTRGAQALLTWRAMSTVWDSLSSISSSARGTKGQLVPKIAAARRMLRVNSITAEDMEKALDYARENGVGDDVAFAKLRDLSLVSSVYDSLVRDETGGAFTERPASETVRLGAEKGFFDGTLVYIDSFFSLTKEEYRVTEELIRSCDVTVTIAVADLGKPLCYEEPVKNFYTLLNSFAYRFTDVERVVLGAGRRAETAETAAVSEYLFDYERTADGAPPLRSDLPSVPGSVRVFSVRDRYDEAEAAASVVEKIVRDGGRYSDVAVIAGDLSALGGTVESCFARRGIPCFRAEQSVLASTPLARHFLSLLRVPGSWRREDLTLLVKTGLTSLTDEEACAFETYTGVWAIRGRGMFSSPWSMNPAGYKIGVSEADEKLLADANSARDKLIPAIDAFASVFDGGECDVRTVCEAMMDYSRDSGLYDALRRRAAALTAAGDRDGAKRELEAFGKFCECFDEIVKRLPGVRCDADGFAAILRFAMTDVGAGAIPTGIDEVALGSAATVRTGEVRHVILLGCIEGEFPGAASDNGFFTDSDREVLAEAGIDIWTDGKERAATELLRFHRCASLPSRSLTVFVPGSSFGSAATASSGAAGILSVLGREKPVPFSSLPLKDRLFSEAGVDFAIRTASYEGDDALAAALREKRRFVPAEDWNGGEKETVSVPEEVAGKIFKKDLTLAKTGFETFVGCPFSYYVNFVLRIDEKEKARVGGDDRGAFIHYVLERFVNETDPGEYPLDDDRLEKTVDGIIHDYLLEMFDGKTDSEKVRFQANKLRRDSLLFVTAVMRELADSRFRPVAAEMKFGFGGDTPDSFTIPLEGGGTVSFRGVIDRMDVYRSDGKTYVRIVDYKTGKAKFNLEDVRRGLEVQLLVYLLTVWKTDDPSIRALLGGGETVPSGTMYFTLGTNRKEADGQSAPDGGKDALLAGFERSGLILDEEENLAALGDGGVPSTGKKKAGFGASEFADLSRMGEIVSELESTVAGIVGMMKKGDCGIRPTKFDGRNPCKYCRGKAVCRSAIPSESRG